MFTCNLAPTCLTGIYCGDMTGVERTPRVWRGKILPRRSCRVDWTGDLTISTVQDNCIVCVEKCVSRDHEVSTTQNPNR